MKYCVIKNTIKIIDGSDNSVEVMNENALNAGITEFEILTEEAYRARVESIPKEPQPKTEIEILKEQLEVEKRNSAQMSTTLMDFMNFYFEINPEQA